MSDNVIFPVCYVSYRCFLCRFKNRLQYKQCIFLGNCEVNLAPPLETDSNVTCVTYNTAEE